MARTRKTRKKNIKSLQKDIYSDLQELSGEIDISKSELEDLILQDLMEIKDLNVNKNAVYQRIYRLQNKLDDKRLPIDEKRKIEVRLQSEKKSIGYKGSTPREKKRLTLEKKSIAARISTLQKKIKDSNVSETKRNKYAVELMKLGARMNTIKRTLGIKVPKAPKKEEEKVVGETIIVNEPPWNVRADYLMPTTLSKSINIFTFIWKGNSIKVDYRKKPDEVFSVWRKMYAYMLAKSSNAIVIISVNYIAKTMEVKEK